MIHRTAWGFSIPVPTEQIEEEKRFHLEDHLKDIENLKNKGLNISRGPELLTNDIEGAFPMFMWRTELEEVTVS